MFENIIDGKIKVVIRPFIRQFDVFTTLNGCLLFNFIIHGISAFQNDLDIEDKWYRWGTNLHHVINEFYGNCQ